MCPAAGITEPDTREKRKRKVMKKEGELKQVMNKRRQMKCTECNGMDEVKERDEGVFTGLLIYYSSLDV